MHTKINDVLVARSWISCELLSSLPFQKANIGRKNKALGNADKQLSAAFKYWDALQPMCTVKHVSYEERVAQRQEEIAALKEAYDVLDAEST